jgi:hypothetical protein
MALVGLSQLMLVVLRSSLFSVLRLAPLGLMCVPSLRRCAPLLLRGFARRPA